MKNLEQGIYEIIKGFADGRVYAIRAPQNVAAPYVVFHRTSSQRWREINAATGMAQATIQIDVYAREYYEAKEMALEIEDMLDGWRGTVAYGTDSPRPSVRIAGISTESDDDELDQNREPFLYRSLTTYLVTYQQE